MFALCTTKKQKQNSTSISIHAHLQWKQDPLSNAIRWDSKQGEGRFRPILLVVPNVKILILLILEMEKN